MKYIAFVILWLGCVSVDAQRIRSYMEKEIVGQSVRGPISEIPLNCGMWVEWSADGDRITMLDGSQWSRTGSSDGSIHYRYVGSMFQPQPFTQLTEAVFTQDYNYMRIFYSFGPVGMTTQMVGIYSYIGEGRQPAEEWIKMGGGE